MLTESHLHDYQRRAIDFIVNTPRCALFAEMGLGKTAIALTAAKILLDDFAICRLLIIAPLRVANGVWRQESAKWAHLAALRDCRINIATGSRKARDAAVSACDGVNDILIINRENVEWLVRNHKWRWDFIIIDESSSFKAHNTKRFRALRSVLPKVNRIALLTGTPSPNSLLDLWAQAFLLDRGERLGKSFHAFRQKYFWQDDYRGYKWKLRDKSQAQIQNQIADIAMSMRTADYLEMPDRIDLTVAVDMPDKLAAQYKAMRKTFALEIGDTATIPIATAAAMSNKLSQFCNGAVYDEDGNAHQVHNLKLDALREIIDDNPTDNLLVAYHYKSDLARLRKAFPNAVVLSKSASEIADWNAGKIKILLAHPQSAAHGINLQAGGALIVWYGLTYSYELYAQFNARLHRQGQAKPVRIIHLVVNGGIDASMLPLLSAKAQTQDALMNYLRSAL